MYAQLEYNKTVAAFDKSQHIHMCFHASFLCRINNLNLVKTPINHTFVPTQMATVK